MTTAGPVTPERSTTPYRHLDYFGEKDRGFAGRDEDIAIVAARASLAEPFVLYGRSGLGKTSLLLAGVFPKLRDRGLTPIAVRVFHEPLVDLRNAIADVLKEPRDQHAADLVELATRATAHTSVVLAFDQFEELFLSTRKRPSVRRDFMRALAALLKNPAVDLRVTFSVREDYLAELDEFKAVFPGILSNSYRLRPLTAFGARQAITAPLVELGIPFDQTLVVELVDLLAKEDFDPVLLQIACGEVYLEALKRTGTGPVHLKQEDLRGIGDIDALFIRYLTRAIDAVRLEADGQLLLSRAVLDALVTPEETKRAVRLDHLIGNDDYQASVEELEEVLNRLERHKLVRRDLRSNEVWFELRHDRLAPSVVKWFRTDSDFAKFRDARNQIAEAARRAQYPEILATLLSEAQLSLIDPYRQRLKLTPAQREFLFWSAVSACSEQVAHWADLYGRERCAAVLATLLAHQETEARLAAAKAAARLEFGMPDLAGRLVNVVFDDPVADVRKAAASALSRHATPAELQRLRSGLWSRSAARALDALAVFATTKGPLESFNRGWRFVARNRARRFAVDRHRNEIVSRGKQGAIAGVIAGAAVSATVGSLAIWMTLWIRGVVDWRLEWIGQAGAAIAGTTMVGALWGMAVARVSASVAAKRQKEGGFAFALVLAFVPLFVMFLFVLYGEGELAEVILLHILLLALITLLTVAYVRLFRGAVWPPRGPRRERLVFAFLLSMPPALLLVWFGIMAVPFQGEFFTMVVFVSLPTITALALTEPSGAVAIGRFVDPWPQTRVLVRGLLALAIPVLGLSFLSQVGCDSLPFLAQTAGGDVVTELPVQFRDGPDSKYFRVRNGDAARTGDPAAARWIQVAVPAGVRLNFAGPRPLDEVGESYRARQQTVLIPRGTHLMSISDAGMYRSSAMNSSLRVAPLPAMTPNSTIRLDDKRWTTFVVPFEKRDAVGPPEPAGSSGNVRAIWEIRIGNATTAGIPLHVDGAGADDVVKVRAFEGWSADRGILRPSSAAADGVAASFPQEWTSFSWHDEVDASGRQPSVSQLLGNGGDFTLDLVLELEVSGQRWSQLPDRVDVPIALLLESSLSRLKGEAAWNDASQLRGAIPKSTDETELRELRQRIIELEPGNASASDRNQLAWEYVLAGQGARGLSLAREAVRMEPDKTFLDTLAHAEFDSGNWAEAVLAWERVREIDFRFFYSPVEQYCLEDVRRLELAKQRAAQASK